MAEPKDKKKDKFAPPESSGSGHFWLIVPLLLIFAVVVILIAYTPQGANAEQINVEYWFRKLYELWSKLIHLDPTMLKAQAARIWSVITTIGYIVSIASLFVIVYTSVKLYELRHREHEELTTLLAPENKNAENSRWKHIQALMQSGSPSDWRQAIIEADIMLEDILLRQGYTGEGISEKLKQIEPSELASLNDAWEAHKVRNRIAHDGSSYDLSQTLAQRTVARYEAVFREVRAI